MLTRRQLFSHALLTGALMPLCGAQRSFADLPTKDTAALANLHNRVLNDTKRLIGHDKPTLRLLYPAGCRANLEYAVTSFTDATGIHIELLETDVDHINTEILIKAANNLPHFDIALPASFGIPDLVSADAILPLDNFARQYEPAFFRDGQLYRHADSFNGRFYGYQTDGDAYLVFYNKAMFDDPGNQTQFEKVHGKAISLPKTWEELDRLIRFFHRPDTQQFGGCLFRSPGYLAWEWWSRFHAKGYFPFDKQLLPQIDNEAGVQALEDLIAISAFLHPKVATDTLFENWSHYAEGQSFCNIGWGGTQKYLNSAKSKVRGRLYFSSTPGGMVDGQLLECPVFNWGWNYVVSSRSAHPELAYLFTLYACSPVISTIAVANPEGFFDPFRDEHYRDSTIAQTYSEAFLTAHKESMAKCIPDLYLPNQSRYLAVLQENIHLAYRQVVSAKAALQATAQQWRYITARSDKSKAMGAWLELRDKYPPVLRQRLKG